jgi:hypothetical protein
MSEKRRHYVSYLLRLWPTEGEGAVVWRASLESAHTGERRGFANLAELYVFLEQQTAALNKRKSHPLRCDDVGEEPKAQPGADGGES